MTRKFQNAHHTYYDQLPLAHGTGCFGVPGGQNFELMPLASDRAATAITQCLHYPYLNLKPGHATCAPPIDTTTGRLMGPIAHLATHNLYARLSWPNSELNVSQPRRVQRLAAGNYVRFTKGTRLRLSMAGRCRMLPGLVQAGIAHSTSPGIDFPQCALLPRSTTVKNRSEPYVRSRDS